MPISASSTLARCCCALPFPTRVRRCTPCLPSLSPVPRDKTPGICVQCWARQALSGCGRRQHAGRERDLGRHNTTRGHFHTRYTHTHTRLRTTRTHARIRTHAHTHVPRTHACRVARPRFPTRGSLPPLPAGSPQYGGIITCVLLFAATFCACVFDILWDTKSCLSLLHLFSPVSAACLPDSGRYGRAMDGLAPLSGVAR